MNDLINFESPNWKDRFEAIQDPTPLYSMRHFVVGQHDTPGQQWAQAVLELYNRGMAIADADVDIEIYNLKIERLEKRGTRISILKAKKERNALQRLLDARLGAIRGCQHLLTLINELEQEHGGPWTRAQLDEELPEYWNVRGARQAMLDLNATGRIGIGNQDMLRMMGMPIDPPEMRVSAIERRFLECGNQLILVATPTLISREIVERDGLECLKGWTIPSTIQRKHYVISGKPVADAYNDAARTAIDDGADYLLCVEDDHLVPEGTFEKLMEVMRSRGPRAIVGAWYPLKSEKRTGAAIVLRGDRRSHLEDDGGAVHEVYAITQGFTIIPTQAFREIPQIDGGGWFATTNCLTQDSFFSQSAREAGWKLFVDTSARIKHVCRETGRIYE